MQYSLEEIVKNVLKEEKRLGQFYIRASQSLKNERSKSVIETLKKRQEKADKILKSIHPQDYRNIEFIKYVPDYHNQDIVPCCDLDADSSPNEIFNKILQFEEKLEEYYAHLEAVVVFQASKDLFNMLIQFKMGQIKEISKIIESYDLAV